LLGDGTIQEFEIPLANSIAVKGRGADIRVYDSDGVQYFTVADGTAFVMDSQNLRGDILNVYAGIGDVIEIAIQQRR